MKKRTALFNSKIREKSPKSSNFATYYTCSNFNILIKQQIHETKSLTSLRGDRNTSLHIVHQG